ncbi:rRNA-processing protein bfr2 [Orbilia oligospora]|uniref:Protein BFR2 n=1 Tax=Orbilia oligospora TaxID=2813651 RepID=A0A8H8V4Y2_ORBOL|nr:rRNA-processing protein bfr2 [Orbilia oligospora]
MPSRSLSLAEQIAQLSNPAPAEFDPESVQDPYASDNDDGSDAASEADSNAGREHYVEVGKSKLRKDEDLHLHPKYNGATISRDDLYGDGGSDNEDEEDEEDDVEEGDDGEDSDASEEDDHDSEDGGVRLSVSPESKGGKVGKSRQTTISGYDDDERSDEGDMEDMRSDEDMDEDEEDEDEDDEDDEDMDDDEDDEDTRKSQRDELRSMMAQEKKNVVANLSQSAKADAEKGLAVRGQRAFFDECLKSRMQIKNALISVNSLPKEPLDSSDDTVRAAEDAAIALWNTISQLRHDLVKSRDGKDSKKATNKRKHEDITRDTSLDQVWGAMKKMESDSTVYRTSTLEKWSSRVQASANIVPTAKKLNQSTTVQTISSQLREHLVDVSGEVAKSKVPQESAPVQKARKIDEDASIYDDTDFYKRLLLVLLEQRGNSATNGGVIQLAPADLQELKVKKKRANVDTKASKGRKLRYHVHEKLQNFMMPDDSLSWHGQQIDEFFSSLMGQKRRMLDEQSEDEEDDGMIPVSQLFRNVAVA